MSTTSTTNQVYAIDASHSTAEFVVRHMMIAKVRGRFTAVAGSIEVPQGSTIPSSIVATIDTGSVATGVEQRDGHLASPDFFDAATFPKIEFKSTKIAETGSGFDVYGDLTIRDKTLPIVLSASYEGESKDPWGNRRIGYEAQGKINRKDFGLTWNQALETGGVAVGDEVKIELTVEGVAQA